MMCHEARESFSALLDEALTLEERALFDAHLGDCADCRRDLERFRKTVALLHAVERGRAPVGFVDRVLAAAYPDPWYRRLLRRLFVPLPVKLPLEVAALVLVAATAVYVFQRPPEVQQWAHQETSTLPAAPPVEPPPPPARPVPRAGAPAPPSGSEGRATGPRKVAPESPDAGGVGSPVPAPRQETPTPPTAQETDAPRPPASLPLAKAPAVGVAPTTTVERYKDAEEEKSAGARDPARLRATPRLLLPPDVGGRLAVTDREAAHRALAELVARLGGTQLASHADPDAPNVVVVEVLVSRAAYAQLAAGLVRIGRWLPERQPPQLPPHVRVAVSITD